MAFSSASLAQSMGPETRASATPEPQSANEDEDVIVTLRANGVELGEFALLRKAGGDFWIPVQDFPKLKLKPLDQARRQVNGETYFSFAALGATGVAFDQAQLTLQVNFPSRDLEGTHIDLSNTPPPVEAGRPQNSAILNYRATARQGGSDAVQYRVTGDLNLRIGELLLRQEGQYDSGIGTQHPTRGVSQLIWDSRAAATRFIAGDVLTAGGSFGTSFTGAGLSLSKLYSITPDVVHVPTAALQLSTQTPADVEVSVDGSTVYRTRVGPGPISLDNLFSTGGARNVRVTVTDATGQRQVIDQPFFFIDSVLAKGLQEYNYFVGRQSALGPDNSWHYGQETWQGVHRYGATDSLTVQAGGEGTREFATGGIGASFRHNVLGVLSLDLLASADRAASRQAKGWATRYTYMGPVFTLYGSHAEYADGFRTIATTPLNPSLLSETRLGASARLFSAATLAADLIRSRNALGERTGYALRLSSNLTRRTSINADYLSNRTSDGRDWTVSVYLRFELEHQQWVGTTARATPSSRGLDFEAGKQLPQGEGVGYRLGVTTNSSAGLDTAFTLVTADWNLKPLTLEFNGTSQLRGGNSHYVEAAVSGSVVGLDGYIGLTRQVGDGFALARLGVPQKGVDIFLNSQLQGKTDAQGNLLIPQVGAYGRQDVSLDDKQMPMQYNLATKRVTIAPAYKSGTTVDFGGRKLRAIAGTAWLVQGSARKPITSRAWTVIGENGRLAIETASAGDFYLEDAPPGRYSGPVEVDGQVYSCGMTVPEFAEAVYELPEGMICE